MWKMNILGCMFYSPVAWFRVSITVEDWDSLLLIDYEDYMEYRDWGLLLYLEHYFYLRESSEIIVLLFCKTEESWGRNNDKRENKHEELCGEMSFEFTLERIKRDCPDWTLFLSLSGLICLPAEHECQWNLPTAAVFFCLCEREVRI